jgi:hypothetical protein
MEQESRTVQLPQLSLRATVVPESIDEAARTIEVIFSTGAPVERYDYWAGERYVEQLSMDPNAIRLERLNGGAPVLNTHSSWDLSSVIGVVEDGTARVEKGQGVAKLRFSERPDVEPFWGDIKGRVIRNISVGYVVHKMEEDRSDAKIPVRTAVDWEPYEISMVPMGADPGAQTRGQRSLDLQRMNPCQIVRKETAMKKDETAVETAPVETREAPAATPTPAPAVPAVDTEAERAAAQLAERERQAEIRKLVRASGMDGQEALLERYGSGAQTIDAIRKELWDKMAETRAKDEPAGHVRVGEDVGDKRRRSMEAAILLRSGGANILRAAAKLQPDNPAFKLEADPGEFRGMRLLRMAEEDMQVRGISARGLDELALAGRALTEIGQAWDRGLGDLVKRGIDGGQVIADFPVALVNAMNKVALGAYALAPATWRRFCGVGTISDFRVSPQLRGSGLGALPQIQANGEFTNVDLADAYRENLQAQTYGAIVALTRQVLVNDDIGFFSDVSAKLGNAAAETIEALVYALLAQNANMGPLLADGVALFAAGHTNLGAAGAIGVAKLDADRVIMAAQTDLAGRALDIRPSVLLVPAGSEGLARTINEADYNIDAVPAGQPPSNRPNFVKGLFSDIVGTGRLAGTRYYMFSDPQTMACIKVAFLNGVQEPMLEQQPGWRVDGIEFKGRIDVAVGAVDFRTGLTAAGV